MGFFKIANLRALTDWLQEAPALVRSPRPMQLRTFPLLLLLFLLLSLLPLASALCGNQTGLLPNPSDPSLRGPYPVSSKLLPGTFTSRNLTVEVFFPYVDAWACVASTP